MKKFLWCFLPPLIYTIFTGNHMAFYWQIPLAAAAYLLVQTLPTRKTSQSVFHVAAAYVLFPAQLVLLWSLLSVGRISLFDGAGWNHDLLSWTYFFILVYAATLGIYSAMLSLMRLSKRHKNFFLFTFLMSLFSALWLSVAREMMRTGSLKCDQIFCAIAAMFSLPMLLLTLLTALGIFLLLCLAYIFHETK